MGNFLSKLKSTFTKDVPDTSKPGTVNTVDVAKVVRTSIYVAIASGLTFVLQNVSPEVFGPYSVFIIPGVTAVIELLNKLAKGK